MGNIFLKLLNMSITAGWLILAVMCVRLLFRKIPKWVNCLLWGVVAVRLVCPFSVESPFSILPSTEPIKSSTVVEGEVQNYIPSIDSRLTIVENTINPMLKETFAYEEPDSAAPLQTVTYAAGLVWCCGMVLLIICALGSAVKLHRLVREGVCVRDHIYICDAVGSPFILGIVRPRIYLSSALSEREMNYILAHETAHLKRKDHWWKALGYFLLCIHWFNPLCWMAYSLFCKDIELACDEKAARGMAFHEKKEYSRVLLSCAGQRSLVMVCPLAFGEVGVRERVKSVLNDKKPTLWVMIAAAAVVVILAVCFLTNPTREYQIRITIPAGNTEPFCYSDEEISPKGSTVTFYAGQGLGDTEIRLLPVEAGEENAYDEAVYITPGMPVEMDVERGAWFKIGVNIQNPTEESMDVYVSVGNVEVRVASAKEADNGGLPMESAPEEDGSQSMEPLSGEDGSQSMEPVPGEDGSQSMEPLPGEGDVPQEDMYAPHRYDMGDLDGNGEQEYVVISFQEEDPDYDGHLEFYFNGKRIYEYEDLLWMSPGKAEYIDLDGDGKKEIFFTFWPHVNSMPLVEYAVLKQTGGSWELLEMIHGEDMLDNGFPIASRYGKEENTLVITCEGTDQEIVYDFKEYYENRIREEQESGGDSRQYAEILEGGYREGDEFGGIAAWGVWEIGSGTYNGRNCLIATHGLEGPGGKFDHMGLVDVYFDYDERGKVHILNLEFREEL